MNTSLAMVDFLGVVGSPWGHFDSSSNVTIFSRGFVGIAIIVELPACVIILRLVGGSARSPTPDRLNSLTLLGTKYSTWFSIIPVERRAGVFRWNALERRGNELYSLGSMSLGLCQDFIGVIATDTNATSSVDEGIDSGVANFFSHTISSVCMRLKHMATTAIPTTMYAEAAYCAMFPAGIRSPKPIVPRDVKQKYKLSSTPQG